MLYICFSQSVKSSLLHYKHVSCCHNIDAIICLNDDLSYGDITAIQQFETRIPFLNFSFEFNFEYIHTVCQELHHKFFEAIAHSAEYDGIVICFHENCVAISGLYFCMYQLSQINCNIYTIHLKNDCIDEENAAELIHNKKILTAAERIQFANAWNYFVKIDSKLRIWKNGMLMSVPESYYDELIFSAVEWSAVKTIQAVVETCYRNHYNGAYGFLYYRINQLIIQKQLYITMNFSHFLECKIKKN